ncbi:MAG TPA: hypothetical protein PKD12_09980, partial [Nitrospira sp.]|nr:hypothetical protein [Nitrospira sp.]
MPLQRGVGPWIVIAQEWMFAIGLATFAASTSQAETHVVELLCGAMCDERWFRLFGQFLQFISGAWRIADYAAVCRVVRL